MHPPLVRRLGREDLKRALVDVPALGLAFAYFFCLLCGYYVVRPVRDALGASQDIEAVFPRWLLAGAADRGIALGELTLQVLFSVTFLCMLLAQPLYGLLVSRFPRRILLPAVYGLFIVLLLGFYALFESDVPGRGAAFFVFMAVFNLFAVSVFWSYMGDVFSNEEARLFYGFIGVGGTLGAISGPLVTRFFADALGVANLLLVSAGFMLACLAFVALLAPWARRREIERGGAGFERAIGGGFLAGLRIVAREPLLRAMACLMFFGVGVGTLLYNEQAAIARQIADPADRAAFYAGIDFWINVVTLAVQLLATPLLMARFGIGPLLLVPAMAIAIGFAALTASPLPLLVAVVQVATRAGEFSLSKPARETVYTRVDAETRYKAKAFIDTAVYRGGDLFFVWSHKFLAAIGSTMVFLAGTGAALALVVSAWVVVRRQGVVSAASSATPTS